MSRRCSKLVQNWFRQAHSHDPAQVEYDRVNALIEGFLRHRIRIRYRPELRYAMLSAGEISDRLEKGECCDQHRRHRDGP